MKELPTLISNNTPLQVVLLATAVGIFLYIFSFLLSRTPRRHFIAANTFLSQWTNFRPNDTPGCYIILIYDKKPTSKMLHKQNGYTNVYVGQSVNMYKRVHNHLTGHGNGDVYADMKYKKHIYVCFIPCKTSNELNRLEVSLIAEYDATSSYNKTKGGAKVTMKNTTE